MNPFYDFFERNVSELSTSATRAIQRQVGELLELFPQLTRTDINVELECRMKPGSPEKIVGPLLNELDRRPGLVKYKSQITDLNYNVERYKGKNFTVRDSKTNDQRSLYTKLKVFLPKSYVLEEFEIMGLKLSFSLEITSETLARALLENSGQGNSPLKRVKDRESYIDPSQGISFDITQVLTSNTGRKETEIELDSTIPFEEFDRGEPVGRIKNFVSYCEEQARVLVFRSRSLISKRVLERGIARVNECLGSASPSTYKIDQRIPQVRNLRVEDLLRGNYLGYGATPKADGYRYFLVIMEQCILLIQPPNTYKVLYEGRDIPREWVGFVFDGEMIGKENWRPENLSQTFMEGVDSYYCIFDVIGFPSSTSFPRDNHRGVIQRINSLKTYFEEIRRQTAMGLFRWSKNFNAIYFQPGYSTRISTQGLKTFLEIKPYEDAVATCWHAADSFAEVLLPSLRYKDDGIIFTPTNQTYQGLNEVMSLKWKPMELLTIDFQYQDGQLLVRREREDVVFTGTPLFPIDRVIIDNPESIRLTNGGIYEFAYTPSTGRFRVTRPRFDKISPNSIKTAVQVWNDCHKPVSMDLIRGIGRDGLIETQRESLWTWLQHVVSKSRQPVCDMSNIRPLEDIPLRFLENGTFQSLFRNMEMYRTTRGERIDFPNLKMLPKDVNQWPNFEILILNGQQCMLLENRKNIQVGDATLFGDEEYVTLLRRLVDRSRLVFVRNLPSIIPGKTPSLFLPERSAFGNAEELVLQPIDSSSVEIFYRLGGVFHDVTTNSYETLLSTTAFERSFDSSCRTLPAGHRISETMEDLGPDRILNGKHFGILWDYVYNALLPPSYFTQFQQTLIQKVYPEDSPMDSLISEGAEEVVLQGEPEPPMEGGFGDWFHPVRENAPTEFELVRETSYYPGNGDVFEILSKAMMLIHLQTPPLGQRVYDKDVVSKRAAELRLLMGGLMDTHDDLIAALFERLQMGIVLVRRLKNTNAIQSYFSYFCRPHIINSSATNGFIILESHLESLNMLRNCSLLTYQGRVLIHPSDPVLEPLFANKLTTLDLIGEKLKFAPILSGKIKLGSSTWPSLHRLFNSLRYLGSGAPEANREYVKEIMRETTENKAEYLIRMEIPKRFQKQPWAIQLTKIIEEYSPRVRPDTDFEEKAEAEFAKLLDSYTEKNKRELLNTGDAFLFDPTYPNNLYGRGLMTLRNQLQNSLSK
jgi:hypothetical protein